MVVLSTISCAGIARNEAVPLCPPISDEAIEGFGELLMIREEIQSKDLDAFIAYWEDLRNFCRNVLPEARG